VNDIQKQFGPFSFYSGFSGTGYLTTCDVNIRLELVRKSTDAEWLETVIAYPHSQKAVIDAAKRRLKWVNDSSSATGQGGKVKCQC
jgi:hypothetical protein